MNRPSLLAIPQVIAVTFHPSRLTPHGMRFAAARGALWLLLAFVFLPPALLAFPPAPHHTLYGVVRDAMGEPLRITSATVVLETATSVQLKTAVVPYLSRGLNYRLKVPMDAGLTPDRYRPSAMRPSVSFRLKVLIDNVSYLPLEMKAAYANLGKPAQSTRLDLTLGEDSDGDGLPDEWERALLASLGGDGTLADIRPGDDSDGDGLTNLDEYVAGTYAFDPENGFRLDLLGFSQKRPVLEFLAIRGRAYTLYGSADLQTWTPIEFRVSGSDSSAPLLGTYSAKDVRLLRVEAEVPADTNIQVYRIHVQ